ncbi:hypothetical protein E2C01_062652 [Portunus trituberculatus]|uniref:Uncharacterized protein n=1 Tax=Portunus trituberculatus TaxID=210409 RepID=A0A5B7H8G8_PORTR|nr:hypothetical protein [Portunus trituberculatus]
MLRTAEINNLYSLMTNIPQPSDRPASHPASRGAVDGLLTLTDLTGCEIPAVSTVRTLPRRL